MRPAPIPPDERRADYAALAERSIEVTPAIRALLFSALDYQDLQRDTWAAGIIRSTPEGEDPIQAVRDQLAEILRVRRGYARWEDWRIRELIARERVLLGGRSIFEQADDVLQLHEARNDALTELAWDLDRWGV